MSTAPRRRAAARAGRALALALTALAATARAEPVRYRFDPTHTFVHFELQHFGTSTIRGRIGPLNGEAVLDRAARTGRVQVEIDPSLASTGVAVLDARLKEGDMLAVQAYPRAYLVAERVEFDGAGRVTALRGELTLRGVSQPLTLTALRFNCYTSPLFNREVCGGEFEGHINRSSVGITHSLPFVSDTVRLLVQVEGVRE
ncbi:MAG TPA: YceI family protein [Burkholderiaceae bacterium]|nr:YceI family protein [Burkholderiaceae bacterium]